MLVQRQKQIHSLARKRRQKPWPSAGLEGYDTDFSKAAEVEAALGVPVLRHREKKPAGGCKEVLQQFGCEAHEVVVVGDRALTDIAFGNLHGMLTVQVRPLHLMHAATCMACSPCKFALLPLHACSLLRAIVARRRKLVLYSSCRKSCPCHPHALHVHARQERRCPVPVTLTEGPRGTAGGAA
jgi:hypothetical protein